MAEIDNDELEFEALAKCSKALSKIDDETKKKISASSRNKPKSEAHKQHISQAMTKYWETIPHRPTSGETR